MTWKCSLSLAEVAARHDHVHVLLPIAVHQFVSLVDDSVSEEVLANEARSPLRVLQIQIDIDKLLAISKEDFCQKFIDIDIELRDV